MRNGRHHFYAISEMYDGSWQIKS